MEKSAITRVLDEQRDAIIDRTYRLDTDQKDVSKSYEKFYMEDIRETLNHLRLSYRFDDPGLFYHYMAWFGELSQSLSITEDGMRRHLDHLSGVIRDLLKDPQNETSLKNRITTGKERFSEAYHQEIPDPQDNPLLDHLIHMRTQKATRWITDKAKNGEPVMALFTDHLIPTLRDVGTLWHHHKISVAKEHYATAVIQNIIGMLYPYMFTDRSDTPYSMVAVCAGDELHEIGMRIIADVFEMEGFDTTFLGSNIPVDVVMEEMKASPPSLLAVSSTTARSLEDAKQLIDAVRKDTAFAHTHIMVGGYQFMHIQDLWKDVGADFTANSAGEAVKKAKGLLDGGHDGR